jgi:RNA polymerase sigma-70 factor (ECF subfamily)
MMFQGAWFVARRPWPSSQPWSRPAQKTAPVRMPGVLDDGARSGMRRTHENPATADEVGVATKRPNSPNELFPIIYGELRHVARRYLGRERQNHTLQPTALVHEAWLRLRNDRGIDWQGRTHGLALGAQAMRRLLIDHGRHQKRDKRGGGAQPLQLDDLMQAAATGAVPVEDLLTLEAALTRLEAVDPRGAQVVVLRFFSGMSSPEVAEQLGLSLRTVESDWTHARAWLKRELAGQPQPAAGD